jgi:hypothetical protein
VPWTAVSGCAGPHYLAPSSSVPWQLEATPDTVGGEPSKVAGEPPHPTHLKCRQKEKHGGRHEHNEQHLRTHKSVGVGPGREQQTDQTRRWSVSKEEG